MKLKAHVQVCPFEAEHLPEPRANSVVQRQRSTTITYRNHVMLVESDYSPRADRIGELRHGSCCIGLIYEHTATDHGVEHAALRKSDIESTLDEGEVGNVGLARFFSG